MKIFLIRHGETASNAARVIQTPETPLSPRGIEQAERLGRRLAGAGIGRILSSDLTRARMTAERLREATGAELVLDPLLQERNFGALRGIAYDDLEEDPFGLDYAPPEGETWPVFHARVDAAWERVLRAARQQRGAASALAVVTHGLVCHSVVSRHLEPAADDGDLPMRFENTSVTVVEGPSPWVAQRVNCTAHLEAEAVSAQRGATGVV